MDSDHRRTSSGFDCPSTWQPSQEQPKDSNRQDKPRSSLEYLCLSTSAAQTTASDAASLLPPETIDSLTSQYMSSKNFDNGDGYSHNFIEQQTRPTNLIVEEDGSVRTKR